MRSSGVLLVDKPKGVTSHGVVSSLRRILSMKKIGHAGTLDPDATGLLVLCIGKATKISAFLMEGNKTYRVGFRLGIETDTYDSTGEVLKEENIDVSESKLREALKSFEGNQDQQAPAFSAVKVKGEKLYKYARRGETVERPSRKVRIDQLELLEFDGEEGTLAIQCSKGTYVRSLVHDLGQKLGCGGITTDIRRETSGQFDLSEAVSLDELENMDHPQSKVEEHLLSIAEVMSFVPQLQLDAQSQRKVLHGNALGERELVYCKWGREMKGPEDTILLVDENRHALALGSYDGYRTVKVSRVF